MGVSVLEIENGAIAIIEGDIDHHTAKNIRETIDRYVENHAPKILKMDFGGVQFMDSSGIGLIMGRFKLMMSLKGIFKVINIPKKLERMVKFGGLEKLGIFEESEVKGQATKPKLSTIKSAVRRRRKTV